MATQRGVEATGLEHAFEAFRKGRLVVILDRERPERGAVFAAAADRTSDDVVNFMANHGRGLIAVAMLPHRIDHLGLSLQGRVTDLTRENYTVSIEAKQGVSTGISAADRARTIQVAVDHATGPDDIVTPGHIFPIRTEIGGVLSRPGWAEASVDLARLAGCLPAATLCQILDDAGELADVGSAQRFAEAHGIVAVAIDEVIDHRRATESFVSLLTQSTLPTKEGDFIARVFLDRLTGQEHIALTLGELRTPAPVLVRLHSECLTGDVFGSGRCDCGDQLDEALRRIREEGSGVLLYLRQEGRGIGLVNKVRAYNLQDAGRDTVEANLELGLPPDLRDFGIGAQMILALGVQKVRLLTNNPRKVADLERFGVEVVDRESIEVDPKPDAVPYLRTKRDKMGHLLTKL